MEAESDPAPPISVTLPSRSSEVILEAASSPSSFARCTVVPLPQSTITLSVSPYMTFDPGNVFSVKFFEKSINKRPFNVVTAATGLHGIKPLFFETPQKP